MWKMKILLFIFPSVFCNEKDWVVVIWAQKGLPF